MRDEPERSNCLSEFSAIDRKHFTTNSSTVIGATCEEARNVTDHESDRIAFASERNVRGALNERELGRGFPADIPLGQAGLIEASNSRLRELP